MSRKRYTPEQIIGMLREAEVLLSQGQRTGEVCRRLGISEQSYYRWRKEYGGLKVDQVKRLKAHTPVEFSRDCFRIPRLDNSIDPAEARAARFNRNTSLKDCKRAQSKTQAMSVLPANHHDAKQNSYELVTK